MMVANINKPRSSFRVAPAPDNTIRQCRICHQKFFPTDKITTAQKQDYHVGCFKCTLCGTKLKNHPDEDHMLVPKQSSFSNSNSLHHHHHHQHNAILQSIVVLQCQRCKLDNEQKYKPRTQSAVAGEKVVIADTEQGDIEQVVDLIGDELEDAVCGMVPRCSTCGGDFLTYKGEIAMVGALKYHKECWQMGKPATFGSGSSGSQQPSMTLQPVQAAKYLPDTLILRLSLPAADANESNDNGKVLLLSTLFFVWTNNSKDTQLKALRGTKLNESARLFFELDKEARANPNHPCNASSKKRRFINLPPPGHHQDAQQHRLPLLLQVDIINEQLAPKSLGMVEPASIGYSKELEASILSAGVAYDMYNLHHLITLTVPCDAEQEGKPDLARAFLTVDIHSKQAAG